jgi:poly-gamma-glutamate synthesis protein (capsule biosynthesis protein)
MRAIVLAVLVGVCAGLTCAGAQTVGVIDTAFTGEREVRLVAFGDVNLGRNLGKVLLRGDTLHPFRNLMDTLAAYDVVFANLESPLSEQNGETEDPHNNYVFTGPPSGAWSLRRGGITVVATANNHALDYGREALRETLANLDSAGVAHAGSGKTLQETYAPVRFSKNGITIALFACTALMNIRSPEWDTLVAYSDTARLFPAIRGIRDSMDFVLLSYHGGDEYTDKPTARTVAFTRAAARAGVDLVLGHHPHVPHGIVREGTSIIAHSLGNFVFQQPSRFWTRHGIALSVRLVKAGKDRRMEDVRCLPVRCGYQPEILPPGPDAVRVLERVRNLSKGVAEECFSWRSH